jgi:hypothetical protein
MYTKKKLYKKKYHLTRKLIVSIQQIKVDSHSEILDNFNFEILNAQFFCFI